MAHWLDAQDVSLEEAAKMMSEVLVEARRDIQILLNGQDSITDRKLFLSLNDLVSDALYAYQKSKPL